MWSRSPYLSGLPSNAGNTGESWKGSQGEVGAGGPFTPSGLNLPKQEPENYREVAPWIPTEDEDVWIRVVGLGNTLGK